MRDRARRVGLVPEEFVQKAIDLGCQGTSISLNEPTLSLEGSLEVFRLARARGVYNTYLDQGCCPGCGRMVPGVWE